MAAILSEGQASVAQRLKRIRRSQMLSIWVSRGNEMTSHNGTLSSSADEVFVLVAPYVASHPIPSSLPLLPRAHLFREAGALNSLSEKPLQTGECEFTRFSSWGLSCELSFVSPWKAANVPKVFCPRKKPQTILNTFSMHFNKNVPSILSKAETLPPEHKKDLLEFGICSTWFSSNVEMKCGRRHPLNADSRRSGGGQHKFCHYV